jgi:Arc/MetJ family transcription regulator
MSKVNRIKITDEMVQCAIDAYWKSAERVTYSVTFRDDMRAALEAALSVAGQEKSA